MASVRTRFAPSPTGMLHIGNVRAGLYAWLYARHNAGKLILRIEDTDAARSTPENTRVIIGGLKWLGLDWDEGPFLQSERMGLYRAAVNTLLERKKAYRCYCPKSETDAKRAAAEKARRPYVYDRKCRYRTDTPPEGTPYAIRVAFEETGQTVFHDLVLGETVQENSLLSDEVVVRSDGSPTYNLCVVIDDHEMGITHVLRGSDHHMNTPKQIQIYKALGYQLPEFGHFPLIFGPDKKKLSKRNNVVAVDAYREMGFLPEALVNFLARIGWGRGDEEIFDVKRLIELFDLSGVSKSPGQYDLKKLEFLNQHWIKAKTLQEAGALLVPFLEKRGWKRPEEKTLLAMVASTRERSKTLVEMADQLAFWFVEQPAYDPKAVEKFLKGKGEVLAAAGEAIARVEPFESARVFAAIEGLATSRGLKTNDVAQPVRVALTGVTIGPPIPDVITLLGKARVAERLAAARAMT